MNAAREHRLTQAEYDRMPHKDICLAHRIVVDGRVVKDRTGPVGGKA
jgi:ribosomal protein S4E